MRIIPKKSNVRLELMPGIGVIELLIGTVGILLAAMLLFSKLPLHIVAAIVVVLLTCILIFPVGNEKGYELVKYAVLFLMQQRTYLRQTDAAPTAQAEPKNKAMEFLRKQKKSTATIEEITPFTGIRDGLIQYGDKYSAAVIEIDPIEFTILSEQAQDSLIEKTVAQVLRTTRDGQTVMMVKLERPFLMDQFLAAGEDRIRQMNQAYINDMLKEDELVIRTTISLEQQKAIERLNTRDIIYVPRHYMVFFDNDANALYAQTRKAIHVLNAGGMKGRSLDNKELAVFLKANYTMNFDPREIDLLTEDQYMDWILPKKIEFNARTTVYDGLITHTVRITDYPAVVRNAWGARIFNSPNTRVVVKMSRIPAHKAIEQIDRSIDELRERSTHSGKTSQAIAESEHIDTLVGVLRLLQGENEKLMDTKFFVTAYDYEYSDYLRLPPELQKAVHKTFTQKSDVSFLITEQGMHADDCAMRQFEAYVGAMETAKQTFTEDVCGIHTSSIAALFPYVGWHVIEPTGIFIGRKNNVPVFLDFFKRDSTHVNSNVMVIGKSGSGKSYATKSILANLASSDSRIFILDPEREYDVLAHNLKGKVVDVGTASEGRLNPFHIIENLDDQEETDEEADDAGKVTGSYYAHLQFLEEFFLRILPGIDRGSFELLNNVIIEEYRKKGITASTNLSRLTAEDYPTFDDLFALIQEKFENAEDEYSREHLRVLINYVEKFAAGGRNANLWNGASTLNVRECFTVFNFQSLFANRNSTIGNAQMLLVMKWLENEIIKNRDYNLRYNARRKVIVVIDEAHMFIDEKNPVALDFMFQMAKRIRKYDGMLMVITQNVKDFVGTQEISRKSTAIINACQYSMIFPLSPNDMNDLCQLYEKSGAINEDEQVQIVSNGRGEAFLISAPAERCSIKIVTSPEIEEVFTHEQDFD